MLESVVERLLSRYLAPYVQGISKEKLSVAVWSGNVELTELYVKPEVSDLLGIPFKLAWGRIGKITLKIPWASLGSSPVCVDIQDVYLMLEPKPIPRQADAELQQQLRLTKMQQIEACEGQLQEVRQQLQQQLQQQQQQPGKDAEGGFFFRLANKVLSTLQVSIKGIHLALVDHGRGFKAGILLECMSLHNTDETWTRQDQQQQQQQNFYKACELTGLAAYCALDQKKVAAAAAARDTSATELEEESEVDAELHLGSPQTFSKGPQVGASPGSASEEGKGRSSSPEEAHAVSTELHDEELQGRSTETPATQTEKKATESGSPARTSSFSFESPVASGAPSREQSRQWHRQSPASLGGTGTSSARAAAAATGRATGTEGRKTGRCRYILKPLHVRLTIAHAAAKHEFSARLEVLKESHGVAIGKAQLAALLQLLHEAGARRKRCERLLLREAHTVCLAPEDLEGNGKTQREFTALYGRQVQVEAGVKGVQPLTAKEERRLQVLYDVVGVRHLAKWRSICREATNRVLEETQKVHELRHPKPPPRRWWQWTAGRVQPQQQDEQQEGDEQPLITQEDIQLIMDSVQKDEILQGMDLPSKYHLSFDLLQFRVSLEDDEDEEGVYREDSESQIPLQRPSDLPDEFPLPPRECTALSPAIEAAGAEQIPAENLTTETVAPGTAEGNFSSFISVSLRGLRASLDCCNRQDYSGEDNAEWAFSFSLADFTICQKKHALVHFRSEGDSSSSTSSPYGRTRVGIFGETGKLMQLPSAILRASPNSLAAARFVLQHQLTPRGNILCVSIHLAPVVASVRPDLLKTLCAFFVFDTPDDVRRLESAESSSSSTAVPRVPSSEPAESTAAAGSSDSEAPEQLQRDLGAMRAREFVEGLREKGETVYAAAVHRLPALLQLELNIAAPIFHFDSLAAGSVSVHLGTLALKTDGPCPYDSLRAMVDLNETRLLCTPKDAREVSLLRPIPIHMHLQVEKLCQIKLDVSFEHIYVEATPEAVALLLAVPASLAKSVMHPSLPPNALAASVAASAAASAPAAVGGVEEAAKHGSRVPSAAGTALQTIKEIPAALRAAPASPDDDNRSSSSSSDSCNGRSFVLESTWRFRQCGFIVHSSSGTNEKGVLKAQISDLEVEVGADSGEGTCSVTAALRDAFVSDPSTDSLLFQSLDQQASSAAISPQPSVSIEQYRSALSHADTLGQQAEAFHDALDEPLDEPEGGAGSVRSLRLSLKYSKEGSPQTKVALVVLPAEFHWRQQSLLQIIQTAQLYKQQLHQQLSAAAETFTRPPFLSDAAFAALHDALQAMQNSLARGDGSDQAKLASSSSPTASGNSSSTGCSSSGDGNINGVPWMRTGMEVGGEMPPLAALSDINVQHGNEPSTLRSSSSRSEMACLPVSLSLDLTVQGAAVSFWEGRSVCCRVGVRDVCALVTAYPNGDSETLLSIRHAAVILNGRCVVAPREHQEQLEQQIGQDVEEEKMQPVLVSLKIRQYGGGHPVTGHPLPFSVCVSGRVNQMCLVYIHQDIQAIINYLEDGIFDLFISKSYEAVKQATTGSRSLFALHIDCPLFFVPENKAAIPALQQQQLQEKQEQSPRPESEAESVALAVAPAKVELRGLGRFFVFSAGILQVSNAYTPVAASPGQECPQGGGHRRDSGKHNGGTSLSARSGQQGEASAVSTSSTSQVQKREPRDVAATPAQDDVAFNLKLDFSGMQLSARDNVDKPLRGPEAGGDSVNEMTSIEGKVLETAIVSVRLQAAGRVSVVVETSPWLLHLSREQLTLLLDVLNENLTGQGYSSAPTTTAVGSSSQISEKGSDEAEKALEATSMEDLSPVLRVDVRLCIPKLLLETSVGPHTPLALLTVHRIAVIADATTSADAGTQFHLQVTGDVFAVDDLRPNTVNYYRRLAHCTGGVSGDFQGGSRESPGTSDGGDIEGSERNNDSAMDGDESCRPAVSLHMSSGGGSGVIEVELRDVTLYALVVGFTDLGKYFSYAYACSTMKRYPKPQAPLLVERQQKEQKRQKQQDQQASSARSSPLGPRTVSRTFEKKGPTATQPAESQPYRRSSSNSSSDNSSSSTMISLRVFNGQFVVFSDLESPTAPLIVWSGDFFVSLISGGAAISLQQLEIQSSKVSRLEAAPGEGEFAVSSSSSSIRCMSYEYARVSSFGTGQLFRTTQPQQLTNTAEEGGQQQLTGSASLAGRVGHDRQEQRGQQDRYGEECLLVGKWPDASRLIPSMLPEGAVLLCESLSARGKGIFFAAATDAELQQHQGDSEEDEADSDADETDDVAETTRTQLPGQSRMSAMQRAFSGAAAAATAAAAAAAAEAPRALTTRHSVYLSGVTVPVGAERAAKRLATLTTKVRMQLVVPKFFLRVSSNDIALLLSALRGVNSDGPTVALFPTEMNPSGAAPAPAAKQQADTVPSSEQQSSGSLPQQQQRQQQQPEKLQARQREEQQQENQLEVAQDVRVVVQLDGVDLLLLDDLRASVVPLVQAHLSVSQLKGRISRQRLVVSLTDMHCGFSFLNVKSGTWDPFIEQLTLTAVYRRDLKLENRLQQQHQQRLRGNSTSGSTAAAVAAAGGVAAADQWTNSKAARALLISSYSPFLLNLTPQLCRLLSWFVPYLLQHIQQGPSKGPSSTPASRTASVVLGPDTTKSGSPSALAADAGGDRKQSATVSPSERSAIATAARGYAADAAAAVAAAQQLQASGAPFRYLNLTGECLYAFTLVSEQQQNEKQQQPGQQQQQQQGQQQDADEDEERETTGAVMVLQVGGSMSLPLEALMEGRTAESSRSAHIRQRVFLAFCPPISVVQQVAEVLPKVSYADILRSLLCTRDTAKTIDELLGTDETQPAIADTSPGTVPATKTPAQQQQQLRRKCVGPFPHGMRAVLVEAMKSYSVTLMLPNCEQLQQQQAPQRTGRPANLLDETKQMLKSALHGAAVGDTKLPESNPMATRTLTSPAKQQQQLSQSTTGALESSGAARGGTAPKHSSLLDLGKSLLHVGDASPRRASRGECELVGQVLSPHPSYKLLLLTSTLILHNRSGMPLEICFLDKGRRPMLLPMAATAAAPLSVLQDQPDTQPGDTQSFKEVLSLDPQLQQIPQWMLERQEHQQEQLMQELLSQQELLRLLQRATDKSVASYPSGRKISVEATRSRRLGGPGWSPLAFQQQEQQTNKYAYTFLLPNQHFMSVPQDAILGSGWALVCFRPAAFAADNRESEKGEAFPSPPDMVPYSGWSECIDTRNRSIGQHSAQCAYVPPEERGSTAAAVLATKDAATAASLIKREKVLFFHLLQEDHKTAFPAERMLRTLTVFPSLTLINTTLTELDVCVLPPTLGGSGAQPASTALPHRRPPAASAVQRLQDLQQRPVLQATLTRQSVFYVYEVPPSLHLSLWLRFTILDGAQWSPMLPNFLAPGDGVVSRILLPSVNMAPVELEVLQDAAEVVPYLPLLSPKQLVAVISAPRLFVDRTGLNIKPIHGGRYSPDFGGYSLLGDSTTPELSLFMVPRGSEPVECRVDVPALHGFTQAEMAAPSRLYTLRLKTDQLSMSQTAGALCRVVSLVPEFLLTNCLTLPLYFKQDQTQGPIFEVHPGETHAIFWPREDLPKRLQFVVGRGKVWGWSGPVEASEETAGRTWVALPTVGSKGEQTEVYAVDVAPEGGVKGIAIRGPDTPGAFVVRNNCSIVQRVMVHTFHAEMNSSSSSSSRQQPRPSEADCHFFAHEGQSVVYGWPFPFIHKSRPCQVLLWLDSKTVAPRKPILFDMANPQYKRYEVSLGLPGVPDIIVASGKRGDDTLITVQSKDSPTFSKQLTLAPQAPQGQTPQLDVTVETSFTSLDVAVKIQEVAVSLICDRLAEELCYASLSQLAVGLQQRGDKQKVVLRIEKVQIDNQMESGKKPVVLANRGGRDASNTDPQSSQGVLKVPTPFLTIFMVRLNSGSRDVVLKRALVEIDDLEIDIDADMLNGLNDFLWSCIIAFGLADAASRRAVSLEELQVWGCEPLVRSYEPPPLPTILSLESLVISRFRVYCWCSFVLDKMHMMSDLLKLGLRILMASGRLELTGARLSFSQEEFRYLRGTVASFMSCLQERYTYHLLSSLFSSLGQSSLLNLPRMPYEFGRNTIGLAANAVDSVSAGLGSLLSTFTFDSNYISKRRQERGRGASGVREGFLSAGRNIGEGVWALSSIVTKPIEGAQKEGVGGFLKGIGKGLVGSLVKPLDRVGQAVSDVTRGIHAEVSKPMGALKLINKRLRNPRMIGEQGQVRPYDETEAQLRQSLGLAVLRPMQKCMTVLEQDTPQRCHLAVLFYPQDIFLVDLKGGLQGTQQGTSRRGSSAGDEAGGQVHVLWHVSVADIREVKAGSHGVIVRTSQSSSGAQPQTEAGLGRASTLGIMAKTQAGRRSTQPSVTTGAQRDIMQTFHIPCANAALANEVYRELLETQRGSATIVELGANRRAAELT